MPIENISEAPRSTITIAGLTMTVPAPFVEGHVLRTNEAAALNQTYAENVRNNFSNSAKKAIQDAGSVDAVSIGELQDQLDEYVKSYDFGVRRGSGASRTPLDPVEREALNLAIEKVKNALRAKGYQLKEVGQRKIRELAEEAVEKNPQIKAQAEQILKIKSEIGQEALDLGPTDPAEGTVGEPDTEAET